MTVIIVRVDIINVFNISVVIKYFICVGMKVFYVCFRSTVLKFVVIEIGDA